MSVILQFSAIFVLSEVFPHNATNNQFMITKLTIAVTNLDMIKRKLEFLHI